MIKVNFNKKKTDADQSKGLTSTGTSTVFNQFTEIIKQSQDFLDLQTIIKFSINLFIVLSFPVGLKIYEVRELNKLENQKAQEQSILNQKQQQLADLKKELDSYGNLKAMSEEFAVKRKFLKEVSAERLTAPKIIEFIQTEIPKDIWLINVKIDLKGEGKKLHISGFSVKESSINYFTNTLQSVLNRKSIFVETKDIKDGQSESIIKTNFKLIGDLI